VPAMTTPALLRDMLSRHSGEYDLAKISVGIDRHEGIVVTDVAGELVNSIEHLRRIGGHRERWRAPVISRSQLSAREQRVEELVRQGYTSRQIAADIGVSLRTVTSMRQRVRHPVINDARVHGDVNAVVVTGRPTLLRDLVLDCLLASELPVADSVSTAPTGSVAVIVLPSARDFETPTGLRMVTVGALPESVGFVGAIRKGATAILPVDVEPERLIEAVRCALRGEALLSPSSVQTLVDELYEPGRTRLRLTPRERDILDAIALGEAIKQTARRLGIKEKTVENTRHQLYRKLGVRSAPEALAAADRVGRNA
jgi:DNA-binding NarL/FixJ family response regulator